MASRTEYAQHLDIEAYKRLKPKLLEKHRGAWCVISWGELVGTYPTLDEAHELGYRDDGTPYPRRQCVVIQVSDSETPSAADLREAEHRYLRGLLRHVGTAVETVTAAMQQIKDAVASDAYADFTRARQAARWCL